MKIGVFVSKRQSSEGGGYTITEELINTLIDEITYKKINKYTNGSHIVHLALKSIDMKRFSDALAKRNIRLSAPDSTGFNLKVNISMKEESPSK